MKRSISRIVKAAGWLLLPAAVLLPQTPPGKAALAWGAGALLSRAGNLSVEIGTLGGWIPARVRIDRVALGDANGTWLEVEKIDCRWRLRDLFRRRIQVDWLVAERIEVKRLPLARDGEPHPPKVGAGRGFVWQLQIDRMRAGSLVLAPAVAGVPLEYVLPSGRVAYAGGTLAGDLAVGGDAQGRVGFKAGLAGEPGDRLSIVAKLDRLVKPALGFDRVSGSMDLALGSEGVQGTADVLLEKGGWQARLDTRAHFADGVLALRPFRLAAGSLALEGGLAAEFHPGWLDIALDSSFADAAGNRCALRSDASVGTSNQTWSVAVRSLDIQWGAEAVVSLAGAADAGRIDLAGSLRECDVGGFPIPGISNFTGRVSGSLSIAGPLDAPVVAAKLDAVSFALRQDAFDEAPELDLRLEGGIADGFAFASLSLADAGTSRVDGSFRMPCPFAIAPFRFDPDPGRLAARLDGGLDLGTLNRMPWFANQHIEGVLRVELECDPQWSGQLRLERGFYEHYDWGLALRGIEVLLEVQDGGLAIRQAVATDGQGGGATVSGSLAVGALDLVVDLAHARIVRREDAEATLSGRLEISGRPARPEVRGRVVVDRADILPDNMAPPLPPLLTDFDAADASAITPSEALRPPFFDLDAEIVMPDQVFVSAAMVESVWGGVLRARSTPQGVALEGWIAPRRGHVDFVGKKFRFTEGRIVFDGRLPSEPVFDNVAAEYARGGFTARLVLNGMLDNPQFRLESDPAMPQDEVLAHVLFNRNAGSITPFQAYQIAAAARQLSAGMGGPGFMYSVRRAVGVDSLEVRGADVAGESSSVAAGKYLTSSLYVEVEQALDLQGETGMMAEYELSRHFSVETSTGPRMRPGIGLNWRYDY